MKWMGFELQNQTILLSYLKSIYKLQTKTTIEADYGSNIILYHIIAL